MKSRIFRTNFAKLFAVLFLIGWSSNLTNGAKSLNVTEYIDDILKQTKVIIAKYHSQELQPVVIKSYDVRWDKLWSEPVGTDRALTINLFDKVFVLEKNRIMAISVHVASLNNTSRLKEVSIISQQQPVKFVRTTVWKTTLYILICHESGYCSLYTGSDNFQLKHRQTFRYSGFPVDAAFFTRANRLYLVVADNAVQIPVSSIIYHWRGTYMDIVAEVTTTGAVSVTTFKYRQSTIIVFAQNDNGNRKIGTEVYEFKNDGVERIQFLSTYKSVSVRHYQHVGKDFVLLTDEIGPSIVYWWDGTELLEWLEIPEIRASDLTQIVHADGDTFFFVARKNALYLYKLHGMSDNCTMLDLKMLENDQQVVDMAAWADGAVITLVLVTVNPDNLYRIEPWELHIKKDTHEKKQMDETVPTQCFADLCEMLRSRMPAVTEAENSWKFLLSPKENQTSEEPLIIPNLIIESGFIDHIDYFATRNVTMPRKIQETLDQLDREVEDVLAASKTLLRLNGTNFLTGNISIDEDAVFDELTVDNINVNYINDIDVRLNDVISSENNQQFSDPLRGENISIHDLEVDSLCGIPFDYWSLKNDKTKTSLNAFKEKVEFLNDSIVVPSNLSTNFLITIMINHVNINNLFDDLFLVNRRQKITGNLYYTDWLQIVNLSATSLNGISSEGLLTKSTNQSFENFFAKTMGINRLYADYINGVPVNESARVSRKNVIKGPVALMNLKVTEELAIETNIELPDIKPSQIYDDVVIHGDVKIKTVDFGRRTSFLLNNVNIKFNEILDYLWTKSTDQTIRKNVSLDGGITIDHLNAKYVNGYKENEFLYTTAENIPEHFTNLYFNDFHVNASFRPEEEDSSLFKVGTDSLTIRRELHLRKLRVDKLFTNVFNGVPIDQILQGEKKLKFNGSINLPAVRVNRAVIVDNLEMDFLNNKSISNHLKNVIYVDEDYRVDSITATSLMADHLTIERINGFEISQLVKLPGQIMSALNNLTIDGHLIVEGDLNVSRINDFEAEEYMNTITVGDTIASSKRTIDTLIVHSLVADSLHGLDFEEHRKLENQYPNSTVNKGIYDHSFDLQVLFNKSLSKSRPQTIPSQFSFNKIVATTVETEFINNEKMSELMWVDEPLVFPGNITFTNVYVTEDVTTGTLNGLEVNELYESLLTIPTKSINSLNMNGSVRWKNSVSRPNSLSFLFENAITKNGDQTIYGNVTFATDVYASIFTGDIEEAKNIRNIVSDTVMDDEETVQVGGKKVFKDNLMVNALTVDGDVGIRRINGMDIVDFNATVFRKDTNESLSGTLSFIDNIKVDNLLEYGNSAGSQLNGVALATDPLGNLYFEYLTVQNNVYLKKLDGIEFDPFVKTRTTLTGNHEIFSDVQFNGLVDVKVHAKVGTINDIDTSQLVLSNAQEDQIISGTKTFAGNLLVDGNMDAPFINGMDMRSMYSEGVFRDEDTEIFGDLIFESDVDILKNTTVSGTVNDVDLDNVIREFDENINRSYKSLKWNETRIEELIVQSRRTIDTLANAFFYLEAEPRLNIYVRNVNRAKVVDIGRTLKLNMYGEDPGPTCGLAEGCWCPFQYEAEFSKEDCAVRKSNGTIAWNFREPNGIFGINVVTNVITSSNKCTPTNAKDEFSTISWMRIAEAENKNIMGRSKDYSLKIPGYLKDADVFIYQGKAYVVLAIYYDPLTKNHCTNSLVYELDFEKDEAELYQTILTDGAWAIETFKIGPHEVYVLLGCFGEFSKSSLYRLSPKSSKMTELRSFPSSSRYVKHLSQENDHFVILDDPLTRAVNIFYYDAKFDNFYIYQSLYHRSRVNGIEIFYADEFGRSDAFIIVTTEDGEFFIYEYMFAGKFQLKMQYWLDGIQTMLPFNYMGRRYVFAGSNTNSTVFRIVQQGPL